MVEYDVADVLVDEVEGVGEGADGCPVVFGEPACFA